MIRQRLVSAIHSANQQLDPIDRGGYSLEASLCELQELCVSIEETDHTLNFLERAYTGIGVLSEEMTDGSLETPFFSHAYYAYQKPSVESQTTISAEGIALQLRKLWDQILSVFRQSARYIHDFLKKVIGIVPKYERRLNRVKKTIHDMESSSEYPNECREHYTPPIPRHIQYNGAIDANNLLSGLTNLTQLTAYLYNAFAQQATELYGEIYWIIKTLDSSTNESDASSGLKEIVERQYALHQSTIGQLRNDFSGDKRLVATISETKEGAIVFPKIQYTIEPTDHSRIEKPIEAPVPNLDDLAFLARSIEPLLIQVSQKDSKINALEEERQRVVDKLDEHVESSDRGEFGQWWVSSKGRQFLKIATDNQTKPIVLLTSHALRVSQAVILLLEAAVDCHQRHAEKHAQ